MGRINQKQSCTANVRKSYYRYYKDEKTTNRATVEDVFNSTVARLLSMVKT